MDIRRLSPLIIYDNRCYLCTIFARIAYRISGRRLSMAGHYSELGMDTRRILGPDALEMFWLVLDDTAYGGRAALLPLLKTMILGRGTPVQPDPPADAPAGCKNARAVFLRSASLISHSRRIRIGQV